MNQKQVIMLEEEQDSLNCEFCSQKKAEIFQATGDYCIQCWQEETDPNV
jgi:hypothetical protein